MTLGVVRNDSALTESIYEKLKEFGLDLDESIVSVTRASNIRLNISHQQQCYSHALHLAVSDVLFERYSPPCISNDSSSDSDSEMIVYSHVSKFNTSIQKILDEVRKTIKLFSENSFNSKVLQSFTIQMYGEDIPLVLNSKTNWNTLEAMLSVFLKVYDCICSGLYELNEPKLNVQKEVLEDLQKGLKPIILSITALNKNDANLLTAEGILEFLLESLSEEKLSYCFAFKEAIKRRIKEIKNENLVDLMRYLQTGVCPETPLPREYALLAHEYMKRLFTEDDPEKTQSENTSDVESTKVENNEDDVITDPLERRLKAAINNSIRKSINNPVKITKLQRLQRDFSVFEHSGKLSSDLSRLLEALSTIKPSCTDNQRAFKVPSHLCPTKAYNSGLEFLNIRIFLKGFLENES